MENCQKKKILSDQELSDLENKGMPIVHTHDFNQSEENRLLTFGAWPKFNVINPERLAEAGFYNIGKKDCVCCGFCELRLKNWRSLDNPIEEHKRHQPRCPYIRDIYNGIPISLQDRQNIVVHIFL